VWEAVYIIEGLPVHESEAAPKEIHADTQGQPFPVFGLRSEGETVRRADVAIMSPYQEDNVRRFGDYVYGLKHRWRTWKCVSTSGRRLPTPVEARPLEPHRPRRRACVSAWLRPPSPKSGPHVPVSGLFPTQMWLRCGTRGTIGVQAGQEPQGVRGGAAGGRREHQQLHA
jgi:hypothetical protein